MIVLSRVVCALIVLLSFATHAQTYPSRPIRFILPFPPGGPTDIAGRAIAQRLSEQLKQPVIPDNRPGATSNLGLELASKAPADGYTIVITPNTIAISPTMYKKLGYDAVKDLTPITLVAAMPNVMATHNSVPAKNLKEFIALAKRNPGKLNFSSSGIGAANHLAGEIFKQTYGLSMVHVPYKGNVAALLALSTGEVDFGTYAVPPAVPVINAHKVRPLAVLTENRINVLPDVPTAKEGGVDLTMTGWYAIFAPGGTPKPLVDRLAAELHKAVDSTEVRDRFANVGFEPLKSTPDELGEFLKSEIARFAKVIQTAGIKPD